MKLLNKTNILYIGLMLLAGLSSSCSSLLYTSVDVLKPAMVTFEPNPTRLLMVDNTVTQPIDYGHQVQYYTEKPYLVNVETDSLAIFTIEALAGELAEKDFFSTITIHDNKLNRGNSFLSITHLPQDSVDILSKKFFSNVILSLDRIKVIDKINEYYNSNDGDFYTVLEAHYELRWSIYTLGKPTFQSITLHDTVYWDANSTQRKQGVKYLPNRKDALIDGAVYAAVNSIDKFIPYWNKVDRYYFDSKNKSFTKGMDALVARNWNEAIELWTKELEKKSSLSLKAKLAHNIAVTYEISGQIDKALEYAKIAQKYIDKTISSDSKTVFTIYSYLEDLKIRIEDKVLLDKQLGVK